MLRETITRYGAVRGVACPDPRVTVYKGIPYAAPPVGENRWRAPQPLTPWQGVLDACRFAPISVQDTPGIDGSGLYDREWHVDPGTPMDEDCLYLNIWTPAVSAADKLPVFVWYFGGGYQWGYPNEMEFDGERIARRGVIVVSVNYRLNVFGFLAHPEITKEAPGACGNFGSLDQQAGLKWVYENISAFGGDPERITIGGQSAGGGSVLSQITCEANRPYIRGAVIMSAFIRNPYENGRQFGTPQPLKEAEACGEAFFKVLGVNNLEEARGIDAHTVLMKYDEYVSSHPRMFPIMDGSFACDDPMAALSENRALDIPILAGSTCDEFPALLRCDDINAEAKRVFGSNAETALSFDELNTAGPDGAYGRVNGIELTCRAIFESRARHGSRSACYYYRFAPEMPGWDHPGVFHSSDLWFFFENLHRCWRPFGGRHFELARAMCDYLCSFIKTGDPNCAGNPVWAAYDAQDRSGMLFDLRGAVPMRLEKTGFTDFLISRIRRSMAARSLKPQACNPYLPPDEFVPDGEPYVFDGRVYVYGSHDLYGGDVFCLGDYVGWSAPVDDLSDWRYEGVIYRRDADPLNRDMDGCLYAPDVAQGPDGRYYLYYVLSNKGRVSVAVCDKPAGKYEFYGYVHDKSGGILGERPGDEPQFDPGVLCENSRTYLYTGFCNPGDTSRHGAMGVRLAPDMLTMETEPVFVAPSERYSEGTGFEGHEYFEAASIRKLNGKYLFIYSSVPMHELCWAISDEPLSGFRYGGVLISNCDIGIDSYKPSDICMGYGGNNHGSMVQIGEKWYIFYHRHTNGTWYSRQGSAEPVRFDESGLPLQVEMTSCGLNGAPLRGEGTYPSYIVCNLYEGSVTGPQLTFPTHPRIIRDYTQESIIAGFKSGAGAGFKYFDIRSLDQIAVTLRGYADGVITVSTAPFGEAVSTIPIHTDNRWKRFAAPACIPDGVHALYFRFTGKGEPSFKEFELIKRK